MSRTSEIASDKANINSRLGSDLYGSPIYDGRPSLNIFVNADTADAARKAMDAIQKALEIKAPTHDHGHNLPQRVQNQLDRNLDATRIQFDSDHCAVASLPPRPAHEAGESRTV